MKIKMILLGFMLTTAIYLPANPPSEEGKSIFLARCAACHNVNKPLTGPALAGIDQRRTIDWIISFVHSSQTMVKNGDTSAVAIFEKFNKVPMPDHKDLTEENIKNIVAYIQTESKPIGADKAPFAKPGKKMTYYKPITLHNYGFYIGYLAVVVALVSVLFFAVKLKTLENKKLDDNLSA